MSDAQVIAIMATIMLSSGTLGGLEDDEAVRFAAKLLEIAKEQEPKP